MSAMNETKPRSWKQRLILPLMAFGIACLITSFFLGFVASEDIMTNQVVPASGGIVGPFTIEDNGTVLEIEIDQRLPLQTWSFVSVALLDENKQWLIGFGDEFWHESGYDGGYWEQSVNQYEANLTIPDDGRYYLKIKPQTDMRPAVATKHDIYVSMTTRGFSTIPHFAAGIIAIIISLILNFMTGGGLFAMLKET